MKENMLNQEENTLYNVTKKYRSISKDSDKLLGDVKSLLAGGENLTRQTRRIEVTVFDDTFINELEEGVEAISKIISNPRTFIREEEELVEAGLANKITTLSIQHFASHTQFIRNIDEDGNVVPEKILTIFVETDTAIYENRFIMTLIKKVLSFVETRYNFIKEHIQTFDSDLLQIQNKTEIGGNIYEIYSRVKISSPTASPLESERNTSLLNRLSELKNKCSYFLHSRFMTEMKGAKEVSNPIHMTNMLRKHPDYHRAYLLWCFIDKYEELGISFDVKEYDQAFSEEYLDELNSYLAKSLLLIHSNQTDISLKEVDRSLHYDPKVIFSLEDETYADGKFIYDAYPDAYKKESVYPKLPEEVKEENERMAVQLELQKKARKKVDELILDDKDKLVFEAAKKKNQREKILLKLIDQLEKENKELRKQLGIKDNEKVDI